MDNKDFADINNAPDTPTNENYVQAKNKNKVLIILTALLAAAVLILAGMIFFMFLSGSERTSSPEPAPVMTTAIPTQAEETKTEPAPPPPPENTAPTEAPAPPPVVISGDTMSIYRTKDLGGSCLYVRTGPSKDYPVIDKLYENDEAGVIGWKNGWAYVTLKFGKNGWSEGREGTKISGWVSGDYLTYIAN